MGRRITNCVPIPVSFFKEAGTPTDCTVIHTYIHTFIIDCVCARCTAVCCAGTCMFCIFMDGRTGGNDEL